MPPIASAPLAGGFVSLVSPKVKPRFFALVMVIVPATAVPLVATFWS
jgi:hypothetical protein